MVRDEGVCLWTRDARRRASRRVAVRGNTHTRGSEGSGLGVAILAYRLASRHRLSMLTDFKYCSLNYRRDPKTPG